MEPLGLYENAHLVVAAIRILEFQSNSPPAIKDICRMLSISLEQGSLLCHSLEKRGIIALVEGGFDARVSIKDHLKIEEIVRDTPSSQLDKELEKFRSSRKEQAHKFESMFQEEKEKKKKKFAQLEEQLKAGLDKRKP